MNSIEKYRYSGNTPLLTYRNRISTITKPKNK